MTRRGGEEEEEEEAEVEEVTAEEFAGSRVWSAAGLMPFRGSFGPNLYNYAWAQAVQNKPLIPAAKPEDENDEVVLVEDEDGVDVEEEGEGEKEEGEIEEGEIDEIMTVSDPDEPELIAETQEKEAEEKDEIGEFDRRVSLILEDLETVTEEEAKMSLEAVCARLRKSFENLKWMHTESQVPIIDALVQQAVMGMHTVHAVVVSSKLKKNEDLLLRLLIHIKNQYSILLASEQLKELDEMVQSLVYSDNRKSNTNASASHGSVSSGKPLLDLRVGSSSVSISGKPGLPILRTPTVNKKGVEFSPLLDLHAEHDEGSLPSPTRENAPPLQTPIAFSGGIAVPAQPIPSNGSFKPYDTDAFKAVSSYQQKYSQNSFSSINRFPSPTPSEDNDGNDNSNDDVHSDEVSSAPVVYNARDANFASTSPHGSSYSGETTAPPGFPSATFKTLGQFISGPPATVKVPANSRDPRLRIFNPEVSGTPRNQLQMPMNSNPTSEPAGGLLNARKHKAIEEPLLDGHNLKRQRNGLADNRNVQLTPGRGGWLEESSHMAPQLVNRNVELEIRKSGNGQTVPNHIYNAIGNFHGTNGGGLNLSVASAPAVSTSTASPVLLPSILKDIALNPTMLLQLVQSQLKTADSARNLTSIPNPNRFPATVSAENGATSKVTVREHTLADKSQLPAQTILLNNQNDVGMIRMKPRDPRRILHNNTVPKCESLKPELAKIIQNLSSDTLSNKDRATVREQGEQAQTSGLPSQPPPQPDIARQFTTNLKSVANMISGTKAANISSAVPQIAAQLIPGKMDKVDVMAAADLNGQKSVSGLASEGGIAGASQEPSPWGDVDHLLDGCDDQQKADIQRERVRRIEEQNTMFAARKLCLVLDLDHTLLNSAKFTEVDLIHDELLRKKEELDRENQYRHLFRFPHMGMWTKLRPGVWNFLDRASKLFELHLYTMGNKLYATEMAKVLDPTGVLFSGRVISRGDDNDLPDADERVPKTKDLDGVLGLESAVVIIDDSVRVWPHNKLNLIVVERYTYFPCSRRQFGLPGPSLLEIDHDERPEAGTLASSLAVIERIHTSFFAHRSLHDVDVRNILAAEQRKILAGCKIVFSRIFPVGEVNPHTHPLWQTAEQFGAVCTNQIDEHVTHVVANSLGTDKVNWALCTGRFVVQPGWVEASALLYRRANEHDFSVKI